MNPNSLIEAYRPGWNEPNFSGFIYASKGLAGNRVWAFAMGFRGGWTHGSYCRRFDARSIATGHALQPLRTGPGASRPWRYPSIDSGRLSTAEPCSGLRAMGGANERLLLPIPQKLFRAGRNGERGPKGSAARCPSTYWQRIFHVWEHPNEVQKNIVLLSSLEQ